MKISFLGAAKAVTGSCHKVECNGKAVLLDCGLHQGHRDEADRLGKGRAFLLRIFFTPRTMWSRLLE